MTAHLPPTGRNRIVDRTHGVADRIGGVVGRVHRTRTTEA